jgi:hypothetical protein
MTIDRNLSGVGSPVLAGEVQGSNNEELDTRLTTLETDFNTLETSFNTSEANFIAGKYTITGVDAVSYTQEITVAHGLGTDNIVLGVGAIGSINGLVDSQIIDSNGYTEYESGNGANLGAFHTITAPASNNLILQARNQSNVQQDITIHYWAQKVTSEETTVAWASQTPVIPTTGVFGFGIGTHSVSESGGSLTIPVYRSGGSIGTASVSYATADVTATAGYK